MEKLIKTGLAERKGDKKVKYFTATHKGTALITVLPEQVQSPLMTAEWEEKLKLVERGELTRCSHQTVKAWANALAVVVRLAKTKRGFVVQISRVALPFGKKTAFSQ